MSTIDEITKKSEKDYITDNAVIDRIVMRLASLPIAEFKSPNTEPLLDAVSDYLLDCEMDESRYPEVSYGEMLGIIELIPSTRAYCVSFGEEYCRNMRLTLLAHVRNLLDEFDKTNDTVHLFMSTTVKGYFDYFASKASTDNIYTDFRQNVLKDTEFLISADTTIKELLDKMYSIQSQKWVPVTPTKEFVQDIRRSFEVLYSFFITHFKSAFPEFFDFEGLKEKYKLEE